MYSQHKTTTKDCSHLEKRQTVNCLFIEETTRKKQNISRRNFAAFLLEYGHRVLSIEHLITVTVFFSAKVKPLCKAGELGFISSYSVFLEKKTNLYFFQEMLTFLNI